MELKIRLEEGTHRRLKVVCAERGVSMQEYVSAWVKSAVEQPVVRRERFGESGKPVVGPGADRKPSQGGSTPPSGAKASDGQGNVCKMCGVPVKGAVMLCDECSKPQ